jgi:hypothetical protein
MKRNVFAFAMSSIVSLCIGGMAIAQTGPTGPSGGQPTVPCTGQISEQDLETALRAIDPNFKVIPSKDGKEYQMTVTQGTSKVHMSVVTSPNGIGFAAVLSEPIKSVQNLPVSVLAELMKINAKQIKLDTPGAQFVLATLNDNVVLAFVQTLSRQVDSLKLTASINDFVKVIVDTNPTWSQVK